MWVIIYVSDKQGLGLFGREHEVDRKLQFFFLSFLIPWLVDSANLVPNISSFVTLFETLSRQKKNAFIFCSPGSAPVLILAARVAQMISGCADDIWLLSWFWFRLRAEVFNIPWGLT